MVKVVTVKTKNMDCKFCESDLFGVRISEPLESVVGV